MEELDKYTPTELLKMITDTKAEHDNLKQEIINDSYVMDELQKKINEKLIRLTEIEKKYVVLIEEINKK